MKITCLVNNFSTNENLKDEHGLSFYILNEIAEKWNRIPRKSLGYFSPSEILEMATGKKKLLTAT